jgi:hypothetical protein
MGAYLIAVLIIAMESMAIQQEHRHTILARSSRFQQTPRSLAGPLPPPTKQRASPQSAKKRRKDDVGHMIW